MDSLGAYSNFSLPAVDKDCFSLKIWFPGFLGMALRKANIIPKLFTLTGYHTSLHLEISL
jgi:hypothetical protein